MEIYVWQAWASNNSGSYTMVGSFESKEKASEVASTLQRIAVEHGQWSTTEKAESENEPSPLQRFCREEGLQEKPGLGTWEDWPQYDSKSHPDIFAIGAQIFVHSPYTISLVPTFGEYIYKKGGRVRNELDHSHHPLVCEINFWWDWNDKAKEIKCQNFLNILQNQATVFSTQTDLQHNPVVQQRRSGAFTVYTVFNDLVQGLCSLQALCEQHEVRFAIDLAEGLDAADPLVAYEKIARPLWERVFSVTLRSTGNDLEELKKLVLSHFPNARNVLSLIPSEGYRIAGVPELKRDSLCRQLQSMGVEFDEGLEGP